LKIIVAGNMPDTILHSLSLKGFEIIKTPLNTNVQEGIGYHPDIQLAKVGKIIVCDPVFFDYYSKVFEDTSYKVISGELVSGCNYPKDVAYNIKVVSDKVFHNFKYTDPVLLKLLSDKTKIEVPQGYSGCSICSVGDNAIITADRGIFKMAVKMGVDALLITEGHIALKSYNYGFIGGASLTLNGTIYFFGDITKHPDYDRIYEFAICHGAEIVSLSDEPLSDYGSALTID